MAEGWARKLLSERVDAHSAGLRAHGLNRVAVAVMAEAGVDISAYRSKSLDRLANQDFDFVVTVCDSASEACPVFPGTAAVIHRGFDDPPRLAAAARTEEDAMAVYARVRDEIRDFVLSLPDLLKL